MTDDAPALAQPSSLRLTPAFLIGAALVGLHVVVGLMTLVWTPYDPSAMTGGRLAPPPSMPRIPLMYGLSATRPG